MKKLLLPIIVISSLYGINEDIQKNGFVVKYTNNADEVKQVKIVREKNPICKSVEVTPDNLYGGNFTKEKVPSECKKSFVTSYGEISPIKIDDGIETYGELETMHFIQEATTNKQYLLVDARVEEWYMQSTIPTSYNAPYTYTSYTQYPDKFEELMQEFGVVKNGKKYDFTNAKTLLLYCNGIWCKQSSIAINNLLQVGYPPSKLKWYRGGIQSWLSLNLPVVTP